MSINLKAIVQEATQMGATDIHLVKGYPIMLRHLGQLKPMTDTVLSDNDLKDVYEKTLNEKQKVALEIKQDLDFSLTLENTRVRVNAHFQQGTHAFSIRLISTDVKSIEELSLPQTLKNFSNLSKGLVLITGPTGSGKSTTQAAMIRHICGKRSAHIITVEDPIEYEHPSEVIKSNGILEQREIGRDAPSFASALRHVLRQDPDVILIGEMRDLETISIALTAAETGHLVISTLHTMDTVQSIERIVDVFPPTQQSQVRIQLSMALKGVCSQHIFPRSDGTGLAVCTEMLIVNAAIQNLIRTAKTHEIYSMIEVGRDQGMHSLDDDIERLLKSQKITFEVAQPFIKKRERFIRYVKAA